MQALDKVIDAAQIVEPKSPDIQFVFVGGGIETDNLKRKVKNLNLQNILFLPRQRRSKIAVILSMADVLLVHLKDDPLFRITIPSKTQSNMAVGRPILMGVRGDAADLVEKAEGGLKCEPENPRSIADVVEKFQAMPKKKLAEMGERGRRYYEQELSLRVGTKRFEAVLISAADRLRTAK